MQVTDADALQRIRDDLRVYVEANVEAALDDLRRQMREERSLAAAAAEQHRWAQQEAECGCAVPEPTEKTGPSFFPASEHSWKPPPPLARGTSADADGVEAAIEIEASTWDVCDPASAGPAPSSSPSSFSSISRRSQSSSTAS